MAGMKYTKDNPPMQCYMRQSRWYKKAATVNKVLGVCWHSTGVNQPLLARYVQPDDNAPDRQKMLALLGTNRYANDWNHLPDLKAGVHCFIGKLADGTVTTVNVGPWYLEAWGVGTGITGFSLNQGWIQFEMCEDGLKNPEYFAQVYREAVHLTAYLCQQFNLDPGGTVHYHGVDCPVITCHRDSYNLGMGSNHGDPYNWFAYHGKTMDNVRQDVRELLREQADLDRKAQEEEHKREEEQPMKEEKRYNTMEEIHAGFPWAEDTVRKLQAAEILSGTDNGLDLSQDMLRLLTIIHKAGGLPRIGPAAF